jgi:integrase
MARPATGQVVERGRSRGVVFGLRFRAYGERHYVTLGGSWEGWSRKRADEELANVLADVRRGIWQPPRPAPVVEPPKREPTFHEFASEWLEDRRSEGLARRTLDDYEWSITVHLLPYFAAFQLSAITVEEVDRYRRAAVAEAERRRHAIVAGKPLLDAGGRVLRPLSASSINKTLKHLAGILDQALEYDLIARNPAKGRRRRLKAAKPRPVHLDSVDQIVAMLDAARELDADPHAKTSGRYAAVATLMFAGPRASELGAALVRDLDLARARLEIGRSKTDAGMRSIDLLPVLRDVLAEHKASHRGELDAPLFPTATGGHRDKDNIGRRVLAPVVKRADELLAEREQHPLPRGVTPHKLRHTFASILAALNRPMPEVMAQLGHVDPGFTLRVYAHVMRFSDDERERLRALVEGRGWARLGTNTPDVAAVPAVAATEGAAETA